MRTGIYVYQATTLSVQATEAVTLTSLDNAQITVDPVTGRAAVGPGIYKTLTSNGITVIGDYIDVVAVPNVKDPWPDASAQTLTALNTTNGALHAFFAVAGAKAAAF